MADLQDDTTLKAGSNQAVTRVLNLYAGIGGNRKLWENVEVTAVENDPLVAQVYADCFPNDTLVVADAHQYLLDHYQEYDFIWSSPPCPTHSDTNYAASSRGKRRKAKYPDMKLYQEIILLQKWFDGLWVVENVDPYYEPLIKAKLVDRHLFWANFHFNGITHSEKVAIDVGGTKDYERLYGYDLSGYGFNSYDRRQKLRNCVHPETGLHILNAAQGTHFHTKGIELVAMNLELL
jgi:DNA (cytosine-5)-methyltransferase 1